MTTKTIIRGLAWGAAAASLMLASTPGPALAHHSFAMFDTSKTVTLVGTIRDFQWTNPHSWIQIVVPDDKGATQEWSIECLSPGTLSRAGWRPKTFQAGDKVTLRINPMKDGSPGGAFLSAIMPDGRTLTRGG